MEANVSAVCMHGRTSAITNADQSWDGIEQKKIVKIKLEKSKRRKKVIVPNQKIENCLMHYQICQFKLNFRIPLTDPCSSDVRLVY